MIFRRWAGQEFSTTGDSSACGSSMEAKLLDHPFIQYGGSISSTLQLVSRVTVPHCRAPHSLNNLLSKEVWSHPFIVSTFEFYIAHVGPRPSAPLGSRCTQNINTRPVTAHPINPPSRYHSQCHLNSFNLRRFSCI